MRVYGRSQPTREKAVAMLSGCIEHLCGPGFGQMHELFDGDAPHVAGGLTASARSVAEVLRCYVEDVLDLAPVEAMRKAKEKGAVSGVEAGVSNG